MNGAIVGLYGLYLVLVGINGNGAKLFQQIGQEKGYVPWIVAVLVLGFLDNNSETKPVVAPFITLLIVALIVTRWSTVEGQVKSAYSTLSGAASTASSAPFWQQFMNKDAAGYASSLPKPAGVQQ